MLLCKGVPLCIVSSNPDSDFPKIRKVTNDFHHVAPICGVTLAAFLKFGAFRPAPLRVKLRYRGKSSENRLIPYQDLLLSETKLDFIFQRKLMNVSFSRADHLSAGCKRKNNFFMYFYRS